MSNQLKLLPFQQVHAQSIERALKKHRVALDASEPGCGKTYVACAVAKAIGAPVVVVTTKATIPSWKQVAEGFGVNLLLVTNYELIRKGSLSECRKLSNNPTFPYFWNVPGDTLIIFDECQKCKSLKSLNSALLISARRRNLRLLLCSATAATNPLEMKALGYALGLHYLSNFYSWAYANGVTQGYYGPEFRGGSRYLRRIHSQIFPKLGSRLRVADIHDFPVALISAAVIETGKAVEIQKEYDRMARELKVAEATEDHESLRRLAHEMQAKRANKLTLLTRSRQAIEMYKVDAMADMARSALEEGMSVVLLVNFTETICALSKALDCPNIICGGQDPQDREKIIKRFQRNEITTVICNISAGGVGVSLHDPMGKRPRLSIISPTYSASDLRQALGRVHRAGGAACVQKICFAAGTVEEHTAELCAAKLANLDLLNDGDVQPTFLCNR